MRKLLTIFVVFGLLTSCDTGPDNPVSCDFDQKAMLANYADNLIIPGFNNLELGAQMLNAITQGFVNDPTSGMLVEIQVTYGAYFEAYKKVSVYGFGPGMVAGMPFRDRFNTYPISTTGIEANISAGNFDVDALHRDQVGLSALAYLIFGTPGQTSVEVAALYSDANRRQYLAALVQDLLTKSTTIKNGWATYRDTFVNNTGNADGSSISLLVNELNLDFETTKNYGFKVPLGKYNGGTVLPDRVEAFHAQSSARLARIHMEQLRLIYNGNATTDGPGLHEYLVCLKTGEQSGTLLADAIDDQFQAIVDALNNVPDPMDQTLIANKPLVDEAQNQMQMITPMLKSEMTSALGVRISYQDTDGD